MAWTEPAAAFRIVTPVMTTVEESEIVSTVPILPPSRDVAPGPAPARVMFLSTV